MTQQQSESNMTVNFVVKLSVSVYSTLVDKISESPPSMIETTEQLKSFPHAVPSSVLSPL